MKAALVEFVGCKHLMRCVPVQKKCLKKQGQEPMAEENISMITLERGINWKKYIYKDTNF